MGAGVIDLYVGSFKLPFAVLLRSNGGKQWEVLMKIPSRIAIRRWASLDVQMAAAVSALHDFMNCAALAPEEETP